jgi:hypothetical protein
MNDSEYIIKGDTEEFPDFLIYISVTFEAAQKDLERILNNPNENDKKLIVGHTNLRIEEVPKEKCWWNGNCE